MQELLSDLCERCLQVSWGTLMPAEQDIFIDLPKSSAQDRSCCTPAGDPLESLSRHLASSSRAPVGSGGTAPLLGSTEGQK